jgi:hypothetical protein
MVASSFVPLTTSSLESMGSFKKFMTEKEKKEERYQPTMFPVPPLFFRSYTHLANKATLNLIDFSFFFLF